MVQIHLKLKHNVLGCSKYLSIIDFVLMLVEFGDNSFNFLFELKTNTCSNEGDVFKNENGLEV
jgi:hypothetical protein